VSHAQEDQRFRNGRCIWIVKPASPELLHNYLYSAAPTFTAVMLHRQGWFILANRFEAQKKSNGMKSSKLGPFHFPLQKTMEQADKNTQWNGWKMFYEKLLETDLAIKTGQLRWRTGAEYTRGGALSALAFHSLICLSAGHVDALKISSEEFLEEFLVRLSSDCPVPNAKTLASLCKRDR